MKKLLGISLVAMMAVTSANAEIASKAYVDSGEGTYVKAANTAGQNIKALDDQVKVNTDKLVLPTGKTTVAEAIADAITAADPTTAIAAKADKATGLTGATKTKITYNNQGIVTAGEDLAASDIPDISATYVPQTQTATTSAAGIVQLADSAAVSAGTAGRVVDAAQLKSVAGTADAALKTVTANAGAGVVTNVAANGTAIEMTKAKVTGADIADDAGIAATQLASGVQTSLGYADDWNTTKATYGDIVTHDVAEFETAGTAADLVGTLPEGSDTVVEYVESVAGTADAALKTVIANDGAGVVTNIAKDGTAVTMTKAKVTGSDIADNAGIAATQLASGVQTTLTNAAADHTTIGGYGDIVTHNASEFATAEQGTFAGTAAQLSDSHFVAADKTSAATAANAAMTAAAAAQTTANAAIPAPSAECADATNKCVLTSAGAGNYAWEVIARGVGE